MSNNIVSNRHDILFLFDVVNGNPNGDPDAGNMPRIEPVSNRGLVSDVCLKRKVRNYIELRKPEASDGNLYEIFVKSGPALEYKIRAAEEATGNNPEETVKWLCRQFYDIRAFGGVLSVGTETMRGSAYGQVRGPVQFTFAESYSPITPIDVTITRCVATSIRDEEKERTMGSKFIVPYALYSARIYVSPALAERTGFTERDLDLLFEALNFMFEHDRSAARPEINVRGIYDFEHVGTQPESNRDANLSEARLGCCHAYKLFEGIEVKLREGKDSPESFDDYEIICHWDSKPLPNGVRLHKRHIS
ncbi:MAG: type I-C CRISPR-associated protein Cas7/Csd2 [Pyrinomonadaceae bacterium]|nr:type I-C CRISPR-associated protein Cas7/Csd2 [Pyrinomonadaceae bacterium]